jgi:hypothetical protein
MESSLSDYTAAVTAMAARTRDGLGGECGHAGGQAPPQAPVVPGAVLVGGGGGGEGGGGDGGGVKAVCDRCGWVAALAALPPKAVMLEPRPRLGMVHGARWHGPLVRPHVRRRVRHHVRPAGNP